MNRFRFIIKSFNYFVRQHIAVFLATMISTAVLTGALIVGDSVKYSLKKLVDKRLGNIEYAMLSGDRFVDSELAEKISTELKLPTAPVLMLQGIAINSDNQKRINDAQILGIDDNFWTLSNIEMPSISDKDVIISQNISEKLNLKPGDELLIRLQNESVIPLNAPFTKDENPGIAIRFKIKHIATEDELGRFSLRNNQIAPYNIFINRNALAGELNLDNLNNIILVGRNDQVNETDLDNSLRKNWTLRDAGLKINQLNNEFELVSDRIFIDTPITEGIDSLNIPNEKILTYFVNSLKIKERETPYSFVTAAPNGFIGEEISDSEIIINSWLANDLNAKIGDSINMKYFVMGSLRTLQEKSDMFIVKSIIPITDSIFNSNLMPDFPGLSDAGNCSDWDTGIPIDLKKIRDKDEDYWNDFRGTPKAFISLEKGLELWKNKFGSYTSIRFDGSGINKDGLAQKVISEISPADLGLSFINLRFQGKRAAANGVDFGELFLSLSFFVIAAAILLLVLIYSLNSESRMSEAGMLFGMGFTKKQIIKLRFSESVVSIILGAIFGALAGILYNNFMIWGLNSIWNDAVHADSIEIFVKPQTLLTGILIGILISLITIYIVMIRKLNKTVISIIAKQESDYKIPKAKLNKIIALLGILSSAALSLFSIFSSIESNSQLMLIAGFLFLVGSTSMFLVFLKPKLSKKPTSPNKLTYGRLILMNAGRNISRSLAVVSLLALGTFTIIITGANRTTFSGTENKRNSGTGGFKLWVENTVPILQNLNTPDGKNQYGLEDENILDDVSFVQFHNLAGDDASCLNLNQVQQPQILGLNPDLFDSLKAFSFAKLLNKSYNPWLELNNYYGKNIIPAYADQTVIQWGLLKKVGDTLTYHNEFGEKLSIILIGGLNSSVFQGNILISNDNFEKNFPSSGGSEIMLVDAPKKSVSQVEDLLNNYLSDYGIEITSTSKRLAGFYSVTNTYLSIFMILGGLGVILGTFGLGIVLMRNMLERKQEIATFKALGFKNNQIFKLILSENLILLIVGIAIGFFSAFIGILPSIISPAFHIPTNFLFVIVLIVFISGLIWILIPAWFSMKNNLIKNLRKE